MRGSAWIPIAIVAAVPFAVAGIAGLIVDADARAFAHVTMAVGLILVVVRERSETAGRRLWYLPELVLILALAQYGYDFLGV